MLFRIPGGLCDQMVLSPIVRLMLWLMGEEAQGSMEEAGEAGIKAVIICRLVRRERAYG